jgi:dienelactone hydrolase
MMRLFAILLAGLVAQPASAADPEPLPGTKSLTQMGDLSALMLSGMEKLLQAETVASPGRRKALWQRDLSTREAYERSVEPNRVRLKRMIGAVDERLPVRELEYVGGTRTPAEVARNETLQVHAVRWQVLDGVEGEGLLLQPRGKVLARLIALPDADQAPEMLLREAPWARRLAENGCQVVIPVLMDRRDTWSGDPAIWMTNVPHREWVYRLGFDLGRHVIGYEVQKVLALVDWFHGQDPRAPIAVAGYGEGGLIAFYAAAVDTRIDAALVSGYFDNRDRLWQEPIYRNVFGLLNEFGDAEIAGLIAPRPLIIEHSEVPRVEGPPLAHDGRKAYAAPGRLETPALETVRKEIDRALAFFPADAPAHPRIRLIADTDRNATVREPGSEPALRALLAALGLPDRELRPLGPALTDLRKDSDPSIRMKRQLEQLVDHTQKLLQRSEEVRSVFWNKAKTTSVAAWEQSCAFYRDYLAEEVIGRFDRPRLPLNPRTRKVLTREKWVGYEVMLDVFPEVSLWGLLLLPKDIKPGERRPVVVCQHGLEGLPYDVINDDPKTQAHATYKAFGARLAEQGFVVFAPHHYYRGGNRFRQLQRLAYPLKKTLFALVVAQHEQLLVWLKEQAFVDSTRIGFYGLSYGGFSAQRLPALVPGYALSINSAEFNDMALKKGNVHSHYSYMFYNTYEVYEWNLANTFNYSDLAGLIAPRPFMVERGHQDGVAPDSWVAAEYAKVRQRYVQLGIGDRTAIEWFNGPHTIHGVGTFAFLHRHLNWPEKKP